jgi:hypothetical protein
MGGCFTDAAEDPKYDTWLSEHFDISAEEVADSKNWILLHLAGHVYAAQESRKVSSSKVHNS